MLLGNENFYNVQLNVTAGVEHCLLRWELSYFRLFPARGRFIISCFLVLSEPAAATGKSNLMEQSCYIIEMAIREVLPFRYLPFFLKPAPFVEQVRSKKVRTFWWLILYSAIIVVLLEEHRSCDACIHWKKIQLPYQTNKVNLRCRRGELNTPKRYSGTHLSLR